MKYSKEIFEELNKISPLLAGLEKTNVFSVPEGYFNELSMNVFKKVQSPTKTKMFTVPEGYFEGLADSVLNRIRLMDEGALQETRRISPMLYSIQGENVFEVPAGYFRDLSFQIMDKINPPAKVIQMRKRDSIWKYAAAAVVTGFIGLSSLMMFNSPAGSDSKSEVTTAIRQASGFHSEQEVNKAIEGLSDEEIIKYLEKTGTDVDNEMLSSSVDDNKLPAPTDYLMDEKVLDTYLEQSDKNSQN